MLFTGEYEHSIDAQQRLAIPSDIRARLDAAAAGTALYLVPGPNGAVWLWPEATFEAMVGAMDQSLLPADEMMEFDELFFSLAERVEMDKAGRIRVPERLKTLGGLGQSVVILGVRDHLELRDSEQWAARRAEKLAKQNEIMLRARQAYAEQQRRNTAG